MVCEVFVLCCDSIVQAGNRLRYYILFICVFADGFLFLVAKGYVVSVSENRETGRIVTYFGEFTLHYSNIPQCGLMQVAQPAQFVIGYCWRIICETTI